MLTKIISGGQTGADQAALDAAIEADIPHGGWIPKGRLAEEGHLTDKYDLTEMSTKDYLERTKQNVLDSDGTLIFFQGDLTGGSKRTADFATEPTKPFLHIDLNFKTHAAAQACFERCLSITGKGIHRLDGDGDGRACESLP